MSNLVRNAIRTPDGTVLESRNRHDYRTHLDANGETYMVDGGLDYARRNINKEQYEELSVYDTDDFEVVRENLVWGSRGKNLDQPLKYVKLKDMSDEHIQAVIALPYVNGWRKCLMGDELIYRDKYDCHIEDNDL